MKQILILALLGLSLTLNAQKHDSKWLYGYGNIVPSDPQFGGFQFDYVTNPPTRSRARKPMDFSGFTMSMCDTAGNLQFYSNGLRISNHANQTMENGDSVGYSNGYAWNYFNRYNWGSDLNQCSVTIPLPGNDSVYYFFYDARITDSIVIGSALEFTNYLSIVDMRYNNGLGKVVEKDRLLMQDTFVRVSACKHANGRDWWVVIPHLAHHKAIVMLVTPDGIAEQRVVRIGNMTRNTRGIFNGIFSPDGERYALHTYNGFIRLFQFDRCSGMLSFERDITVDNYYSISGVAFSPNSRYLYKIDLDYITQLDLESPLLTRDTVARNNRVANPRVALGYGQLMPDGKIYIVSVGTAQEIHVIHAPDSAGLACRAEVNAIISPVYNDGSMPYFPNYRLGPLRGSGCDTLVSGVETSPTLTAAPKRGVNLSPNPASIGQRIDLLFDFGNNLTVEQLSVTDMLGKMVHIEQLSLGSGPQGISLNTNNWASGVYFVKVRLSNQQLVTQKLLIQD